MMRLPALSALVSLGAAVCSGPTLAAEKLAPLDAEFLEFLASFDSDEDLELFVDDEPAAATRPAPSAPAPAATREGSKPEAAAKPAEKR